MDETLPAVVGEHIKFLYEDVPQFKNATPELKVPTLDVRMDFLKGLLKSKQLDAWPVWLDKKTGECISDLGGGSDGVGAIGTDGAVGAHGTVGIVYA